MLDRTVSPGATYVGVASLVGPELHLEDLAGHGLHFSAAVAGRDCRKHQDTTTDRRYQLAVDGDRCGRDSLQDSCMIPFLRQCVRSTGKTKRSPFMVDLDTGT